MSVNFYRKFRYCLNRVTDDSIDPMLEMVEDRDHVICRMPMYGRILKAGLRGEELTESYEEIGKMVDCLLSDVW